MAGRIFLPLIESANGDMKTAKFGIIYIDDIDSILRKTDNVLVEAAQKVLLEILRSPQCTIPPAGGRKEAYTVSTCTKLFICTGTFAGIDKVIHSRNQHGGETSEPGIEPGPGLHPIEPQDLISFGLSANFIAQMPVVAQLDPLTQDDLMQILTEPKNAIAKEYTKLLSMEGVQLIFTKDGLCAIAKRASETGTGAHALRSILEGIMLDVMYEVPSRDDIADVTINRAVVEGKKPPIIRRKRDMESP